jgi:hypothetical protein
MNRKLARNAEVNRFPYFAKFLSVDFFRWQFISQGVRGASVSAVVSPKSPHNPSKRRQNQFTDKRTASMNSFTIISGIAVQVKITSR